MPTLATASPSNYGRVDAEDETNLSLIEGIRLHLAFHSQHSSMIDLNSPGIRNYNAGLGRSVNHASCQDETARNHGLIERAMWQADRCPLLNLPRELVDAILMHLSATELCSVSATCRKLHIQAGCDFHWLRCVQQNVPGLVLSSPGTCKSFRELYMAHDPIWFLPKYKIWYCDRDLMGKLIIVRFDPRRGCIEGYQLLAVSKKKTFEQWSADSNVTVHGFEPQVKLHLDKPVLQLNLRDRQEVRCHATKTGAHRFAAEIPMMLGDRKDLMFSNFLLTRPMDPKAADAKLNLDYPYDYVWPPPTVPAGHHVPGARSGQAAANLLTDDPPRSRDDVSDQTFRIRQWMRMPGTPSHPSLMDGQTARFAGMAQVFNGLSDVANGTAIHFAGASGIHTGEEVTTYSTLDPVLYTPTETKPWRGIWVGDYSGHGCEFLLINQPDGPPVTDAELGLVREMDETDEAWGKRRRETYMYRGRLEAIKLTGDPNVPRGEYTFVADDLGPDGYIGVASGLPFAGARVVKSKGHIAATGFVQAHALYRQVHRESTLAHRTQPTCPVLGGIWSHQFP